MYNGAIALTLSSLVATALTPAAMAQGDPPAITEAQAHAIGVDAYVYFYSLVTMDVTRKQFTNLEPGKMPGRGPMNMFNNVPTYPPADDRGVVRPNFDTLYSIAYLDMTRAAQRLPQVFSAAGSSPGSFTRCNHRVTAR